MKANPAAVLMSSVCWQCWGSRTEGISSSGAHLSSPRVRLESCVLLHHRSQANNACHSAQGETPSPVQWHHTHCSLCWLGSTAGNSASGESNWNSALVLPMTQTSPCTEAFIISQHLQQCSYHLTSLFLKYIHTYIQEASEEQSWQITGNL